MSFSAPADGRVVELEAVTKSFGAESLLTGVDLALNTGDYIALVGPSGVGKTTLLNVLALLDRPTTGSYRLCGEDVGDLSDAERSRLRGCTVGLVFQHFYLLEHRTVLENVVLGGIYTANARQLEERASELLELVRLGHRTMAHPTTLSGGERQRVVVARALMASPALILADEPTGNLDSETGRAVLDLLEATCSRGTALVVVTHDPGVAARAGASYSIRKGRLEPCG